MARVEDCPGYQEAAALDAEDEKRLGFPCILSYRTGHLLHCEGVCKEVLLSGEYGFHNFTFKPEEQK